MEKRIREDETPKQKVEKYNTAGEKGFKKNTSTARD